MDLPNQNDKTEKLPVIVTSNVKKTVRKINDFNTSMGAVDVLNQTVHAMLEAAVQNAYADGRKTVMARDFKTLTLSTGV